MHTFPRTGGKIKFIALNAGAFLCVFCFDDA